MTGRRGVRKQATSTGGPQTLGAGLGQVTLVSDDQYNSKDRGRRGPSPSVLPAWVDVHGIIFVAFLLAFVVWPAAQGALDL